MAGETCLAPFSEAAQPFSGVLAAHDARQQRCDTVARRVRAATESGARAGQGGLHAQRGLLGDKMRQVCGPLDVRSIDKVNAMPLTAITTGLGTGSCQTPNGSKRCESHSTCGPFPATAGSDPSTLACLRGAQQR